MLSPGWVIFIAEYVLYEGLHGKIWTNKKQTKCHSYTKIFIKYFGIFSIIFSAFPYAQFSSVQSLSPVWLFATPWITACQASLSITNSRSSQTHVHWVGDAIQPSHPLSSPSPPAPNPSQHQGLFQWVSSLHEVAKVLEFQPQHQHQSFQWTPRTDLL